MRSCALDYRLTDSLVVVVCHLRSGARTTEMYVRSAFRSSDVAFGHRLPGRPLRSKAFARSSVSASATTSQEQLKKQAADKAVEYVRSGMVVGLGTGSTASYAVERIGELMKLGKLKDIVGVPTSTRTYELAKSEVYRSIPKCTNKHFAGLNIPLATLDEQPKLDVAIDGADEVDPALDVIKGRGGALLRERVCASGLFWERKLHGGWVGVDGGSSIR